MRSCDEFQELISAMLDGELTDAELAEVNAHIAVCEQCRAMYEAFSAVSDALRAVEVPDTLHDGIIQRVESARKVVRFQKRFRVLRPLVATAACLIVIVGTVFFGNNMLRMGAARNESNAAPAAAPAMFAMDTTEVPEDPAAPVPMPETAYGSAEEKSAVNDAVTAASDDGYTDGYVMIVRVEESTEDGFLATALESDCDEIEAGGQLLVRVSEPETAFGIDISSGSELTVHFTEYSTGEETVVFARAIELQTS